MNEFELVAFTLKSMKECNKSNLKGLFKAFYSDQSNDDMSIYGMVYFLLKILTQTPYRKYGYVRLKHYNGCIFDVKFLVSKYMFAFMEKNEPLQLEFTNEIFCVDNETYLFVLSWIERRLIFLSTTFKNQDGYKVSLLFITLKFRLLKEKMDTHFFNFDLGFF